MATRDIVVSAVPGGRFGRWAFVLAGVALLVLAAVSLEGWTCNRFSACILGDEQMTRVDQLHDTVARIELGVARDDPELISSAAGVILTNRGVEGLLISSTPIAQTTRIIAGTAGPADLAEAAAKLVALPPEGFAVLVRDFLPLFHAHPQFVYVLMDQLGALTSPDDCQDLNAMGWRAAARNDLAGEDGSDLRLTVSLYAEALDCDRDAIASLVAMERG